METTTRAAEKIITSTIDMKIGEACCLLFAFEHSNGKITRVDEDGYTCFVSDDLPTYEWKLFNNPAKEALYNDGHLFCMGFGVTGIFPRLVVDAEDYNVNVLAARCRMLRRSELGFSI